MWGKKVKQTVHYTPASFVDMHTHILPGMDDGARDAAMSAAMLARMAEQGITSVVSTSHFYPEDEAPDAFLARRREAALRLREVYDPACHPQLFVGAEVAYYPGISRSAQTEKLRILGTRYILIEMPFCPWSSDMLRELLSLGVQTGLTPVLAHMERCLPYQPRTTLSQLLARGVLLQSNAEYFLNKRTSKEALRYLSAGHISFLGSDAHNTEGRPPSLGEAFDVIARALGTEPLVRLEENGKRLIEGATALFDAP